MMRNMTSGIAVKMLRENTGTHFLDSGGSLGRHWQQNQHRDFTREGGVTLDFSHGIEFTVNLYHWIQENLSYDAKMQRRLNTFAKRQDQQDNPWMQTVEEFVDSLKKKAEKNDTRFGGIYGEGDPVDFNSYNGECNLSQTIQGVYWEDEEGDHVLLQVHNGADVRGGYTAPRAFTCTSELSVFNFARGRICCTGDARNTVQTEIPGTETGECKAAWDTDDSYHWYASDGKGEDLNKFEIVKENDEDPEDKETPHGWRPGILYVRADGAGLCPHCGSTLKGRM